YRPNIVFHAAAYKHVHLMQDNIDEAITNNVLGTKQLFDSVARHNIPRFTFISTDKVVNPTSVMGATKKLCEYYIDATRTPTTTCNIVRFGNVINSNGSVLPLFERQIAQHRYVTVTHAGMQRFFMSIREAAQLVIESTIEERDNAVHLLNMGELINVHDVAISLIRSKNLLPNIDVNVQITGLRKGEKLIEELYTETESAHLTPTKDNRMFSLEGDKASLFDIHQVIAELQESIVTDGNGDQIRTTLKRLFPSLQLSTNGSYLSASANTASSLSPSTTSSNTR
ncbi:MAG: polysaccharide biosynthesis protein, partial [Candidatus Saccharibacteria bacterium]|nr:polysaccharide biosynthesis protein [Candidatus Saccharibacteria bacterium]